MIGNWRWNMVAGLVSGLMTMAFSFSSNVIATTLLRSLYSFMLVFALVFVFRWMLGTLLGLKNNKGETEERGHHIDYTSPAETESLREILKEGLNDQPEEEEGFSPISPPRFVSANKLATHDMVEAVRRMSED